ncbi:hypothetical protein ODJ79_28010 [Actinoplanes sp. KI2]|uniref:hypothetical protein n=1 Tax=Actinoplanes sp. KI2 TaxID=2983315 RepID=UPI0021D56CF5|nr:hypothetical protein [Actinoplanes sp. KI2]MCU7727581.1 hypothetical protein [Actinoplanes sp. KI2]
MRSMAFAAPLFLLAYGVLRWIDGRDGHHHKGSLAWNVGHLAFLASMVTFALLAVALYRRATLGRRTALVAAAVAVFGAGGMIWVIIGDLSRSFAATYPLPDVLQPIVPIGFVLGMIGLLSLQVAAGRVPVWSPMLFFAGYTAISINLDLLPLAALLILGAMWPLARPAVTAAKPAQRPASTSQTA